MFSIVSFMFFLQQNWRTKRRNSFSPEVGKREREGGGGGPNNVYKHAYKCKKDKIKLKKIK
jgi:hypothetical protein